MASIVALPTELLNLIFSFVFEQAASYPSSQADLQSLALTSKTFLPIAQAFLFSRPLAPEITPTVERAVRLLSTLKANDGRIGRLVRKLDNLVFWASSLSTSDSDDVGPPRFPVRPRSFSWFLSMLSCCPNLVTVDLTLSSSSFLSEAMTALSRSTPPTITTASITGSRKQDFCMYRVPHRLVFKALRQTPLSRVTHLKLQDIEDDESDGPAAVSLQLESLEVRGLWITTRQAKQYLPVDSSSLRIFILECDPLVSHDIDYILSHLSPSIEIISVTSPDRVDFSHFNQLRNSPSIPHEPFARFFNLVELTLEGFHGPTSGLMEILGVHCSRLKVINFQRSIWRKDETFSDHGRSAARVPREVALERITTGLESLVNLSRVVLGEPPVEYRSQEPFLALLAKLSKKGIDVGRDSR